MTLDLRKLADSARPGGDKRGEVRVMVAVKSAQPGAELLQRLAELGLRVESVVADKIVGSIAGDRVDALRADAGIAEVSLSSRLRPH